MVLESVFNLTLDVDRRGQCPGKDGPRLHFLKTLVEVGSALNFGMTHCLYYLMESVVYRRFNLKGVMYLIHWIPV